MARKAIETNISYDEKRKLYYVTLNFGKDQAGKYVKKTKTTSNKREAKQILNEHKKKMAAGNAVAPTKETLVSVTESYLRYKE